MQWFDLKAIFAAYDPVFADVKVRGEVGSGGTRSIAAGSASLNMRPTLLPSTCTCAPMSPNSPAPPQRHRDGTSRGWGLVRFRSAHAAAAAVAQMDGAIVGGRRIEVREDVGPSGGGFPWVGAAKDAPPPGATECAQLPGAGGAPPAAPTFGQGRGDDAGHGGATAGNEGGPGGDVMAARGSPRRDAGGAAMPGSSEASAAVPGGSEASAAVASTASLSGRRETVGTPGAAGSDDGVRSANGTVATVVEPAPPATARTHGAHGTSPG